MPYIPVAYTPAHLPELVDLWIAAWTKAMPRIAFEARRAWLIDHLAALENAGTQVVCLFDAANGTMAGFVTLDPKAAHVDQLAVAPAYWSKGAGDALIAEMKRRAPRYLKLEVNQDNPRAVRFYEKHGFRRIAAGVNPVSGLRTWRYEWGQRD